jgi:deazaflavin-dependent oxidoreductase (nitroreductase family)
MNERQALDQRVVDDFRARGRKTGGPFADFPLLVLHHTGAKSGTAYTSPLAFLPDGDNWVVFAANGARPTHPGWYYNLRAEPSATVEVEAGTFRVTARIAEGSEREELCERFREVSWRFRDYEKATTGREIPVIVLERVDGDGDGGRGA